MRTTWPAASLLHHDPATAQAAANQLQEHLLQTAPGRRTPFETSLADSDTYMANLREVLNAAQPCLIWQRHGAYKPLFRFLALRFLLALDQVLDVEGTHARWQWVCGQNRGLSLVSLHATLRLTKFLGRHGQEFPDPEVLAPLLEDERAHLCRHIAQIDVEDDVAPGWRSKAHYMGRFNLRAADLDLLGEQDAPLGLVNFTTSYQETASV